MIRLALLLWLAFQNVSPEASQHWDAARRAESQKHYRVQSAEFTAVV